MTVQTREIILDTDIYKIQKILTTSYGGTSNHALSRWIEIVLLYRSGLTVRQIYDKTKLSTERIRVLLDKAALRISIDEISSHSSDELIILAEKITASTKTTIVSYYPFTKEELIEFVQEVRRFCAPKEPFADSIPVGVEVFDKNQSVLISDAKVDKSEELEFLGELHPNGMFNGDMPTHLPFPIKLYAKSSCIENAKNYARSDEPVAWMVTDRYGNNFLTFAIRSNDLIRLHALEGKLPLFLHPPVLNYAHSEEPIYTDELYRDEPVCWLCSKIEEHEDFKIEWAKDDLPYWTRRGWDVEPLYLHPQRPMKPMTEEELEKYSVWSSYNPTSFSAGVRFAERHHGISK